MERLRILNTRNQVVGYIEQMSDGRQRALDAHFHVVGYYDPRTNRTLNEKFSAVGIGNSLAALVSQR
jgi:hypothetical protein